MGALIVIFVLVAVTAMLWWMTYPTTARIFLWAICSLLFWSAVLLQPQPQSDVQLGIVAGGLVWTLVPPIGWLYRSYSPPRCPW